MSGSRFMDALLDPGVQALGGMAQGFAQAAMPTRMPTPFGAVLGAGVGGLTQGAGTGLQLQKLGMENRLHAAQLPMELARTKMLSDFWQHPEQIQQMMGGGTPFGAPAPAAAAPSPAVPSAPIAGAGTPSPSSGPSIPFAANNPLNIRFAGQDGAANTNGFAAFPTVEAGQAATDAQFGKYADRGINTVRQLVSTWAPPNENDTAGYIDRVAKQTGINPDQQINLKDPSVASVIQRAMAGVEGNKNARVQVAQAGGGAVPVPQQGQAPPQQSGQAGPSGGIPKSPEEALAMAQQYEQRANDLERQQATAKFFQAQGVPAFAPPGDAGALRQAAAAARNLAFTTPKAQWEEAVKLQYAAPIAAAQANAAVPATLAGKGFSLGPNDTQQFVPGSAADPAYISASEFAKPQVLRPGGMVANMRTGEVLKNPELHEATLPNGTTVPVHINPPSPFAPPGTAGTATGINMETAGRPTAGGAPGPAVAGPQMVSKLPPQIVQSREDAVKEFMGKDSDAYQAAQNTQAWLHQIDHAADTMSQAGPLYMTGPHADLRLGAMSDINDMARTLGIKAPFDQNAVASFEEMNKATTTAGFELSSHYEGHARQAAATIMNATSAVPGVKNSPIGLKLVSAGIREGAQSAIDLHNYRQQMMNETQGGDKFVSAENDFYQAHPAEQYAQRAISTVHPVKITDPAQFSKYLPGTYALLPNGKLVQVPTRPDAPPVPAYLQPMPQQ